MEDRHDTTCLSVPFTKTLAVFTAGSCLDTQLLLNYIDEVQ